MILTLFGLIGHASKDALRANIEKPNQTKPITQIVTVQDPGLLVLGDVDVGPIVRYVSTVNQVSPPLTLVL